MLFLHILIIETFSIRQNYCKLLVAGAGKLDPGVPGSLRPMTASWLRGTLEPVNVLGGGSEQVLAKRQ